MKIRTVRAEEAKRLYSELKPGTVVRFVRTDEEIHYYMILPTGDDKLGYVLAPKERVAAIGLHHGVVVFLESGGVADVVEPELLVTEKS